MSLAYQTLGDGSPDVVFVPGFVSHVEAAWEDPAYAGFMRRLATDRRLIIFNKRGTGLSDSVVEWPSFVERVDDMFAVMDAAGSERAVLFGVSEGAAMCALAAARHRERVAGLVLHTAFARILRAPDYPWGWTPERFESWLDLFEEAWTTGAGLEVINPSLAGNQRYLRWCGRYLRLGASPGMARRLMRMNGRSTWPGSCLRSVSRRWSCTDETSGGSRRSMAATSPSASPGLASSCCPGSITTRGSARSSRCTGR